MSKPFSLPIVNPLAGYTAIATVFALQKPKPWTERNPKSSSSLTLRKEIRTFFEHISDGKIVELFYAVLAREEREALNPVGFTINSHQPIVLAAF